MKTTDRKRTHGFEMRSYRRLFGIKWSERRTSLYVLQRLNYSNKKLLASMFKRKLSSFGHKIRRSCLEKDIILGMVEGKRRLGRRARVWVDDITYYRGIGLHTDNSCSGGTGSYRVAASRQYHTYPSEDCVTE